MLCYVGRHSNDACRFLSIHIEQVRISFFKKYVAGKSIDGSNCKNKNETILISHGKITLKYLFEGAYTVQSELLDI